MGVNKLNYFWRKYAARPLPRHAQTLSRRSVLAGACGAVSGCATAPPPAAVTDAAPPEAPADPLDEVALALLGMQRLSWEQGLAAQAMHALGREREWLALVRGAVMRQQDGRLAAIAGYNPVSDAACNGEPVLRAAERTGDPALAKAARDMLDAVLESPHRAANGALYHSMEGAKLVMPEALYMAPPFLAAAGRHDEALRQIAGMRALLWSEKDGLYAAAWDDARDTVLWPAGKGAYRGLGNGWAAAGIARVITALPGGYGEERAALQEHVRVLLASCLARQRSDGLFHYLLGVPSSFVETNLAQMLAYTIFLGVKDGWLDRDLLEAAGKMRAAVTAKADDQGYVQGVCGVPDFARPGVSPEGQAFHILMEAAARDCLA